MSGRTRLWWRLLDPLLRRIQSRMGHLAALHGPHADPAAFHALADADVTVEWLLGASASPCGDRQRIRIGRHSSIRGSLAVLAPGGHIRIGTHCYVGLGSNIWSQVGVDIGHRVLISHQVDIHDTNAHPLDPAVRAAETVALLEHKRVPDWSLVRAAPIRIEDDVWVGFKSTVLKGVTIGRGAVVAAGAVVTKDVESDSIVAGNPARVIGYRASGEQRPS